MKKTLLKNQLSTICFVAFSLFAPAVMYGQEIQVDQTGQGRIVSAPGNSAVKSVKIGRDFNVVITGLPTEEILTLELGFIEPEQKAAGERLFNVVINDKVALTDFDIVKESSGLSKAVAKRFTITPRTGSLDFHFSGVKDDAVLAYIRLQGTTVDKLVSFDKESPELPKPGETAAAVNPPVDSTPAPEPSPAPESAAAKPAEVPSDKPAVSIPLLALEKSENEIPANYDSQTMSLKVDKEHKAWKSGLPIGGIGTGKFEILPSGEFANFTINNSWDLPVLKPAGTFLAVAVKATSRGGTARLLQSNPTGSPFTKTPKIPSTIFKGIFPFGEWDFSDPGIYINVKTKAWGAVVPQDQDDSNLPAGAINVVLHNPNKYPVAAAVALSWEDINGRGGSLLAGDSDKFGFAGNSIHEDVATSSIRGIKISSASGNAGRKSTFTGEYFIGTPIKGVTITRKLGWNSQTQEISWWKSFSNQLRLDKLPSTPTVYKSQSKQPEASALCVTVNLAPQERRQIPFVVSWYMPQIENIETDSSAVSGVAPEYATRFKSAVEVANYFVKNRVELESGTRAWHDLVMQSNLPSWLRVHTLNSLAPIISNSVVLSGGKFALLDSVPDMHGMLGGLDSRFGANDFLATMYPVFFEKELSLYAKNQKDNGLIPRYIGNIHGAVANFDEKLMGKDWLDATAAFVYEVSRLSAFTGNDNLLESNKDSLQKAENLLRESLSFDAADSLKSLYANVYGWKNSSVSTLGNALAALTISGSSVDSSLTEKYKKSLLGDDSLFANALSGDTALKSAGLSGMLSENEVKQVFDNIWKQHFVENNPVPSVSGSGEKSLAILSTLQSGLGAGAILSGSVDKGLEVYMRMFKVAYGATHSPWRQSQVYSVPLASEFAYRSSPSAMSAWSVWSAITGAAFDANKKELALNPGVPTGLPNDELKAPVFTSAFWGILSYNDKSSTGTLSVVKVMPGFKDKTIESVSTHFDNADKRIQLPQPFKLEEGQTLELKGWPKFTTGTVVIRTELSTEDIVTTQTVDNDKESSGELIETQPGTVDRQGQEI